MIGRREGHGRFEPTHIDMVPMVDCIMVLVIFLMISSAFLDDFGIGVSKPDVSGGVRVDQNVLFISITADNRVYFDGQELRVDQVAGAVRRAAIGPSPAVVIRGDRSTHLDTFAAVYAQARHSGVQRVEFATARND